MESSPRCPQCTKPLAAGTPHGLCPECLFRAGFATGTPVGATKRAPFVPPAPAELAPLFPQLEILALIGQGGMGAVYQARQPKLDRMVALKILPPQAGRDPGFAERFTREARALARLSHPNIVGVHEFGAAGEYPYFVMEFVDGVTLRHLLATAQTTPREALAIVPQICDALQFAHDRGVVHRDIKPENILIDKSGAVKIADFGLAKIAGGEQPDFSITGAHDVVGTPHYMAPEQVEHPLDVDHRADIYSVGVVFYQMLTGELPIGRFAPPSRKVTIDVRLDEIVLRALEKEPELRYQQASGLKSEVETITASPASGASSPQPSPHLAPRPEHRDRRGWHILIPLWAVAALILGLQASLVTQYLDTAGRLGLRGAPAASTPLQQIFPAFATDAQMWVRHALALTEEGKLQLRQTDVDNAPHGRAVHWASAWAWCIAGAGKLHQAFTGLPYPRAVERATLWLNPLVMFGCIVLVSSWTARHLGSLAGVVVIVALLGHDRIYEGFFPGYVDHHGLATMAVIGLVLGAVVMGVGWWQRTDARSLLPGSPETVRHGAIFSASSGACGLWISAASTVPAIAFVGGAGVLALLIHGRNAARRGAIFEGSAWRLWGRVGGGASLIFYGLEYFPGHLGFRLETNQPFYALAWLGAGELIAQWSEHWLAPREKRWQQPATLLWPVLALAVVVTLVASGSRMFSVLDPFMARLHRDYVAEFFPLWRTLDGFDRWGMTKVVAASCLPLLAVLVTLAFRRGDGAIVMWFATFVTAALTAMGWWQARWILNASGASIVLLVLILAWWTAAFRPKARWIVTLAIVGIAFIPGTVQRYWNTRWDVAQRRISPADADNALSRDIAAVLRSSQPQGEIVLLASPNASARIGYYGRIKTLGTLYWENSDGLKAAAEILGARSEEEAARLIRMRGVTHVAIIGQENFIAQYYRLLHPGATNEEVRECFGLRLMNGQIAPRWLRAVPYQAPDDLQKVSAGVMLFSVHFE